jgi:hypothetical protein
VSSSLVHHKLSKAKRHAPGCQSWGITICKAVTSRNMAITSVASSPRDGICPCEWQEGETHHTTPTPRKGWEAFAHPAGVSQRRYKEVRE